MTKKLLIIFLLLVAGIPAVKALFAPGGFTSHDLTHHVIRQISMDKLLSEGQFPPRWSGELNNGYGYPVFLFNYPLPALLGEVFHKAGLGYVDSVKAVLLTSMILSVLGMYLFLKSLLGLKLAAFLGAIFYLYDPIRFLNVYVSAAVGSALAAGIMPFVFWSLLRRSYFWGSLSLSALILAHNVTALIFAPLILFFGWKSKKIILLGVGLSAWFWLPAVFEAQYTRFGEVFGKFYQDQFPSVWQLLRSPWGYGLSHPSRPEPGDMSYQLGLIHIGVILALAAVKLNRLTILVLATFTISVFLMLKISLPLWENVPFLSLIQFPLRFQALAIFSASIAAGLLVKHLPNKKTIFLILLSLVIYANRNHWNINQAFDPGENYYLNLKTTSTSYGEHLPKWGRIIALRPAQGKLEFVKGVGKVRVVRDKSALVEAEVEATGDAVLRLNQFYFPGWEIQVDGKKQEFNYLLDGESYGLPLFDIEPGNHQIKAEFKNTPVRNLADGISIVSLGVLIMTLFKSRQR